MKSDRDIMAAGGWSHSPQGECGLKFLYSKVYDDDLESLPARGVWIEIRYRVPIIT